MKYIYEIDSEKQLNEIVKEEKIILEFYADWCGLSKMLKIQLEQINIGAEDKIKILKINVEKNPELVKKYNVISIPTMIFKEKGIVLNKVTGFRPKEEIIKCF